MLAAGWHAHTLDAPGKFYVLADGHTQPRRARAYLVTDDNVQATASHYADARPSLDRLTADAIHAEPAHVIEGEVIDDPEARFWQALRDATDHGLSIRELMQHTGMRRTWIYDRLQQHTTKGRIEQVTRGRWRATDETG